VETSSGFVPVFFVQLHQLRGTWSLRENWSSSLVICPRDLLAAVPRASDADFYLAYEDREHPDDQNEPHNRCPSQVGIRLRPMYAQSLVITTSRAPLLTHLTYKG
jgi:hypothetical protein